MRSLADAAASWDTFTNTKSLEDLQQLLIRTDSDSGSSFDGLRSIIWRAFLVIHDAKVDAWPDLLQKSRATYESQKAHLLHGLVHRDEEDYFVDPLSEVADSPWTAIRHDEEVRQEILQDVERCMPDNLYFREPGTQAMLLDILFVWSKLNPDVGYRQGMHEVLAPILWVVERDAVSADFVKSNPDGSSELMATVLDESSIESDSFSLFEATMQGLRSAYEPSEQREPSHQPSGQRHVNEPSVVKRANKIAQTMLLRVDPTLAAHLIDLEIVPQLYIMRWIRLLFGREFPFNSTIELWDRIIMEGATSDCVDLVCVSMLLRRRWELLNADYNEALAILLQSPKQSDNAPQTLVDDAIYLGNHLDLDGGRHVISKRTGRPPAAFDLPQTTTIDSPSRVETALPESGQSPSISFTRPKSHIETILQTTARGVYARGEQWGVNKTVRDAVNEFKTNVKQLRNTDFTITGAEGASFGQTDSSTMMVQRIEDLQARNRMLATILGGAVDELWKQHQSMTASKQPENEQAQAFTMAIAKVQLAQVYLEDPSLPLVANELSSLGVGQSQVGANDPTANVVSSKITDEAQHTSSSVRNDPIEIKIEGTPEIAHNDQEDLSSPVESGHQEPAQPPTSAKGKKLLKTTRPSLEQSSFSWMLDSKDAGERPSARSTFVSASPFIPNIDAKAKDKANLFGDDDDGRVSGQDRRGSQPKNSSKDKEDAVEGINLGTWKGRR